MDDIEEKRVYGDRTGAMRAFVAADLGIVAVSVADGRVGEFGVAHRCSPRDVAAADGRVAVAAESDVLADGEFRATGFGPAVAVGFRDGRPVAAGPDGRVAGLDDGWDDVGTVEGVTAIDGDLVGADGGVYRIADTPVHVGLADVRDVSAAGVPLAATANGLYALGNGWMDVLDGDFRVVAERPDGGHAHAAATDAFYERADGDWRAVDLPTDEPVVDVAYGDRPYAVTADGTFLSDTDEGWRAHPLGLRGVVGIAVP